MRRLYSFEDSREIWQRYWKQVDKAPDKFEDLRAGDYLFELTELGEWGYRQIQKFNYKLCFYIIAKARKKGEYKNE